MKKVVTLLILALIMSVSLYAQTPKDTVNVESDIEEGNLNVAVQTAIDAGTLSNTVFKLEPYGYYVLTGTIVTPQGEKLEIVAPKPTSEMAPPQIVWTSGGGVNTDYNFDCYGDVTMKNIWIRYADVSGLQVGSCLNIRDDELANTSGKGEVAEFDNVIFDYAPCPANNSSGAVQSAAKQFHGTFTNCYFKNCIDEHLRYYGRALSFPYQSTEWHNTLVYFENCTFANMGYVLMQEGNEYSDNVHFNHCTFYNIMEFALESGWWYKMSVTNSLFVNTFMYGDIPAQSAGGDPNGATVTVDSIANFGFEVPFGEQDRRILFANNSYCTEPWLVAWMHDNPYSVEKRKNREGDLEPVPQPMLNEHTLVFFDSLLENGEKAFPYMNRADLYDGLIPGFVAPPINMDSLKIYLQYKWDTNENANWAFQIDDGYLQTWPLPEDLSYTNDTLKTAAMSEFPLGDLYHWWPAEYEQWAAQAQDESDRIFGWLENGVDPTTVNVDYNTNNALPMEFVLEQNYPNPFNPTTQINYSIPANSHVTLKVYNTLGQEIATLFDGTKKAGNYQVTFDGSALSSGVYFYRLQSDNVTLTKKFALMK